MVEGWVILLILTSTAKYTDGYIVGKLHNNLTRHKTSLGRVSIALGEGGSQLEDFDLRLANACVLLTKIIGVKCCREGCDGV